jgi:hypothetical protein
MQIFEKQFSHSAQAVISLVVPLLALTVVQFINLGTVFLLVTWVVSHLAAVLVSYAAFLLIFWWFVALTNHYIAAYVPYISLTYLVAVVDHAKWQNALTHFVMTDLLKSSDPSRFADLILHYARPVIFLPIIALLAGGIFFLYLLRSRPFARGRTRLLTLAGSTLLLVLMVNYHGWVNTAFSQQVLHLPAFSDRDFDANVRSHGILLAFFGHIGATQVDQNEPAAIAANTLADIRQRLQEMDIPGHEPGNGSGKPGSAQTVKPTIIILTVEALWDVTRINGVDFANDPFAEFRADYAGEVISSCFGGQTANTEFEFLTSYSMYFMNGAACPFLMLDRPIASLASSLKDQGYRTTAMHSFSRSFYNRNKVMPLLGFDQFLGIEDFPGLQTKGWYAADEDLAPSIIKQLEQDRDPQLIYILTMQNHGPYYPERYKASDFDQAYAPTFSGQLPISARDQAAVKSYTQGVVDAGKLYRQVKTYCEQLDRPIIILTFGDHLPGIGETSGTGIFLKSGLAKTVMDQALYSLPVMYWRNAAAVKSLNDQAPLLLKQPISFNYLAPALLTSAGLPLNAQQDMARRLAAIYPILTAKAMANLAMANSEPAPAALASLAKVGLTADQVRQAFEYWQYEAVWK